MGMLKFAAALLTSLLLAASAVPVASAQRLPFLSSHRAKHAMEGPYVVSITRCHRLARNIVGCRVTYRQAFAAPESGALEPGTYGGWLNEEAVLCHQRLLVLIADEQMSCRAAIAATRG